jgi:hypothetical protein
MTTQNNKNNLNSLYVTDIKVLSTNAYKVLIESNKYNDIKNNNVNKGISYFKGCRKVTSNLNTNGFFKRLWGNLRK